MQPAPAPDPSDGDIALNQGFSLPSVRPDVGPPGIDGPSRIEQPSPPFDARKQRAKELGWDMVEAVMRAAAFGVCVAIHKGLDWALEWMMPQGLETVLLMLKKAVFGGFSIIYLALLYEIVAIFIPVLRTFKRK